MKRTLQKYFVLDIGSTSARLVAGYRDANGNGVITHDEGCVTSLIRHPGKDGTLVRTPETGSIFLSIEKLFESAAIEKPRIGSVLCTQAIRQLRDSAFFLNWLEQLTGVRPEVLSVQREGHLAYLGSKDLMSGSGVLVDLGGGSTEIFFKRFDVPGDVFSIPAGAGNFGLDKTRSHVMKDYIALKKRADRLWKHAWLTRSLPTSSECVILGGTATNLLSVYYGYDEYVPGSLHGKRMTLSELRMVTKSIALMSPGDRECLRGLEKGRETFIVSGACLLLSLCEQMGMETLTVSERGIRYGRLYELLQT